MSDKPTRYSKRDAQLADDWKEIANSAAGRRVIADLMTWGNVYSRIEGNQSDSSIFIAVGESNLAKRVAYYLGYRPDDFPRIADEHTDLLNRLLHSSH
jgi:hypothetical protein